MRRSEKRKYKRLDIELDLSCRNVSSTAEKSHTGQTVNVSPGGLYFETGEGVFEPDNLLKVELSIPPTSGLLESGGRICGFAKVLRTEDIPTNAGLVSGRYGVAVEFCRSPKLRM
jgi:hypothetical protein